MRSEMMVPAARPAYEAILGSKRIKIEAPSGDLARAKAAEEFGVELESPMYFRIVLVSKAAA